MSPIGPRKPAGGSPPEGAPAPAPAETAPAPAPAPVEAAPATPPGDAEPAPAPTPAPTETAPAPAPAPAEKIITPEAKSLNPLFDETVSHVVATGKATLGSLSDRFPDLDRHDLNQLMYELERNGIIGPSRVGKSREILVTKWPPDTTATPDTATPDTLLTRAGGAAADLDTTASTPPVDAGTTPAEPAPAEPEPTSPPDEPEPAPVETPPATPEGSPAPPAPETRGRWESIRSTFKSAYDRFVSKFRGEAQPEDAKEYKASWGDVAKNAASGFLSVAASYTGVKILADLPAWLYQKYWTNPAERQRIKDALAAKETEFGDTAEPTAIDQKKAKLEEAINASKFLTKEKKAELLDRLHATVRDYEDKDKTQRTERNEKIAKLLDQAIETRVKNTQILKEGLNSALMVTGLAAMRGVAYGAVATYERHQEVAQRLAQEAKARGETFEKGKDFYKEWIVGGFTDTLKNLAGGDAKLLSIRGGVNFVKGATNVLRAAGFADLAIAEWTGEGRSVESIINTSLKAWEDKGVATGWDNIKAPWERLGHLGEYAKAAVTGSEPAPGATPETPSGAAGAAGAAGVAAAESAPHVEVPEAQIEAGLVKKGDGVLKILERQGVEAKAALEAAREAGIVRAGGDTRLTTEAIGRLSIFTETKPDGGLEIKFFDTQAATPDEAVLTLEEARAAGFTYESGTVPGEIPTEKEVTSHAAQPIPDADAETSTHGQDSPDVPNELLNGTFKIETDESGNFVDVNYGDGDPLQQINAALAELAAAGHGNSLEAHYLEETYNKVYQLLYGSIGTDGATAVEPAKVAVDRVTGVAAGEPIKKFVGEAGKVKFIYDKDTGDVKDAIIPPYTPGRRDIEDSLNEWGLTNEKVKDHFSEGKLYRWFVRDAERLTRQEALLYEMEENRYSNSLEYAHLKKETERLEKFVAGEMKKEFSIQERPI